MNVNEIISSIEPSKSVTLLAKAKAMQKEDPEIINLTGGEPNFPTPKPICDEIARQLSAGNTHYTDSKGNEDLRIGIAKKLKEDNDSPFTADQILVTPGAKMAVYLATRALLNPGDEALWLTPGWVSYPSIIQASGGIPVAVHLDYDQDYLITEDLLEAATSDKTKLLILNYPNNPTGRILRDSELSVLCDYLRAHPDIYVISDEIYETIIYDGKKSVSLASYPEFFERIIVINGFSKCSAMTGWRIGYLACADKDVYSVIMRLFQHTISCTSGFLQKGALVALSCKEETEEMRRAYEHRRNLLVDGIREIPGVEFISPSGAFYAWVKFDTDLTSAELCDSLLTEAKIACVPGDAYGEEGKICVRFSFAASDEDLQKMLCNLRAFILHRREI